MRTIGSSASDWPACALSFPSIPFAILLHLHDRLPIEVGRAREPRIGEQRREDLVRRDADEDLRRTGGAIVETTRTGAATIAAVGAVRAGARAIRAPAIPTRRHRHTGHIGRGTLG